MPIYNIRGIDVDFPYDAYDCQIVYMEKVIQSLQERCNALLESPTGTGKTLCLLCATLAWRKSLGDFSSKTNEDQSPDFGSQPFGTPSTQHQRSSMPAIIYTSRTHSQLKQVVRELKASNYRPKMAVLGSREQLCIHDDVQLLQGRAQNNACQHLRRKRSCHHHSLVPDYMKMHPELGNDPIDIEDLVNIGRKDGPCPYYISRELHKVVDILFAPYNYLIDPGNRRSLMGIQWRDSVLIFDEAHNLEPICADAASFDLPSGYLTACISEAQQCVALSSKMRAVEKSAEKRFDPDTYEILKALLLKLERRISEVVIESKELGFTRPGPYIYEFLSEMNITFKTANSLIGTIDNAAILLEEALVVSGDGNKAKNTVCRLESIRDILNIIFRDGGEDHAKYYRFHVQECQQKASDTVKGKVSRTLSWWCFNPGVAMEQFTKLEVRSIILTSGTLSPLDSFAMELHLDFPVRLENPHVISSNQVWVGVVPSGPSGCSFNSSFRYRDSLEYRQELGNAIVNFSRIVPDGLLVFFPSYYLMDQCIECWKNMSHASSTVMSTIWERICRNKQPVVEPKQSALFAHAIEDFKAKLRDTSTSGVVFFAVCRGKVSEGLDFADHYGRAVVITGMPFPTLTDPKIRLKREYLDQAASSQKKDSKVLIGVEWYFQQASRAVNQAIGRVIRHRHDYGAIVFCDERFAQQNHQNQVSLWLQPHIKCYPRFGDAVFTLTKFFREQGTCESLNPKVAESLNTENDCEVKICQPRDRIFSTKDATTLAGKVAEECSRKSLSSMLVSSRGKTADYLEEIIPANRSMLSHKQDHLIPMKHSRDLLCFQRLQTVNVKRKDLQYQDCEVVDLTGDAPAEEQPRIDDVMAPCSSKKSKIKEAGHDEKLHFVKLAHVDQFDNVDSELLPMKSFFSNLEKHHKQISQVLSCGTADVRTHGNTQRALVSSEMISRSMLTRNKDSRGSAFLLQVQENLTTAEYKEFVGHMKALKSKTSKVISVLESIAKLFSAPGRLFLLKRFKDYVPVRYQPLYEEYLKAQDAAFGSEGELGFTV